MFPNYTLLVGIIAALLSACTNPPGTNIDGEPALGVLGGLVQSTQNKGLVAFNAPQKTPGMQRLFQILNPVQEAFAYTPTACTDMTVGTSCVGASSNLLVVFYNNCETSGFGRQGLWRTYVTYTFAAAADCTNALTNGFNNASAFSGPVLRQWGSIDGSGDNVNVRLAQNGEVAYFYADYPSGWQEPKQGGATITFSNAGATRTIDVTGIHAFASDYSGDLPDLLANPVSDLSKLPSPNGKTIFNTWDHTINTVQTGDTLFAIGPSLDQSGPTYSFGGMGNNTTASFDGTIVINGNTVQPGATFHIQHNISESIAVMVVTKPLVYSDPTCCYPTSGEVQSQFDRDLRAPTLNETIAFNSGSCGVVSYTSSLVTGATRTLSHCF